MPSWVVDLLKIGIPSLLGVVGSWASYVLGRKNALADKRLEEGFPLAKEISSLFMELEDDYEYFEVFFDKNFEHLNHWEAAEYFERQNLYQA